MANVRQLIIGNSTAALSALEAIRRIDRDCSVTIISDKDPLAYSRVLLPYYISGRIKEEQLFIRREGDYVNLSAKRLMGRKVVEVKPEVNRISLEDGSEVEYDNLLIATGASASPLRIEGIDCNGICSLRTLEDSRQILTYLEKARDILLIGAGLVSFHLVNALFDKKRRFILVESTDQVLPQMLDPEGASIVESEMEKSGIEILKGQTVQEITQKAGLRKDILLSSGERIEADLVIVAVGITPNVAFLGNSGISIGRGILVSKSMRTNWDNIFAAGDVAEGDDFLTSEKVLRANWINAVEQGRIAGYNMTGMNREYPGSIGMNVTEVLGMAIASIGMISPYDSDCEFLTYRHPSGMIYRKLVLQRGKIVGAILLGKADDAGIISSLVRRKEDIANLKQIIVGEPFNFGKIILSLWKR